MIARKTFSVKVGGVSYHVPAGREIPGVVLDYWKAVKSMMIAEHTPPEEIAATSVQKKSKKVEPVLLPVDEKEQATEENDE